MGLWSQCEKEAAHPSFLFLLLPRSSHPPLLRRHNALPPPHPIPRTSPYSCGVVCSVLVNQPEPVVPRQVGVPVKGNSSVALNPT